MPVPFLLLGAGAVLGVLGAEGHCEANETNAQARKISQDAQNLYEQAKSDLEISQNEVEKSLIRFEKAKETVLNTSISQFIETYEHIKKIQLNVADNKAKYIVSSPEVVEMREMAELYKTTISSGVAGGVAGVAVTAGAVSAFPLAAAISPLSAVIAPAIFFSGISSAIKADENLEKAYANYAEVEAAVEKMKIIQTQCDAITTRTNMLDGLLEKLEKMFSKCTDRLENMVNEKMKLTGKDEVQTEDLTEEELNLVYVTRALAGTVKAVIDTPILSKNGEVTFESHKVYEEINKELPELRKESYKCFVKKKVQSSVVKDEKWKEVKAQLEKVDSAIGIFGKNIRGLELESEDLNKLIIRAISKESAVFLKQNCDSVIKAAVKKVYGCDKEIVYSYITEIK